jgi:hypothetical protein
MSFAKTTQEKLKLAGIDVLADVDTRSIRIINKQARLDDQPHLYPYRRVADSAIRWYARQIFPANGPCSNLEYILGLEAKMSELINA